MTTVRKARGYLVYSVAILVSGLFALLGKTAPGWAEDVKSEHNAKIFHDQFIVAQASTTTRTTPSGTQATFPVGNQNATFPVGNQKATFPVGPEKATFPVGGQKATFPVGPEKATFPVGGQNATFPVGPEKATFPVGNARDIDAVTASPAYINRLNDISTSIQSKIDSNQLETLTVEEVNYLQTIELNRKVDQINSDLQNKYNILMQYNQK